MITAKEFASQSAFWHRATPTLEQYTRWVNTSLKGVGYPVAQISAPGRRSFVAESAFEALISDDYPGPSAQERARAQLQGLTDKENRLDPLSDSEMLEANGLKMVMRRYVRREGAEDPKFRPYFSGCGVVQSAFGDVVVGSQLIEIKAVSRGFRSLDFRQLLTYAALSYSEGLDFEQLCLLNPRRAHYFSTSSEGLALDIGSGSWIELMQDLVLEMSNSLSLST